MTAPRLVVLGLVGVLDILWQTGQCASISVCDVVLMKRVPASASKGCPGGAAKVLAYNTSEAVVNLSKIDGSCPEAYAMNMIVSRY